MPRRRAGRPEPASREHDLGPQADPESVARTIVLTRLTARPRSRAELAEALAARAVPDEVSRRVLDRFEGVGLVDDAGFAEAWVRSRQESHHLSRRTLAAELRRKGVDADVVRQAVSAVDDDAEQQAARCLVDRRLRGMTGLDRSVAQRRLLGLLARRGYSAATARAVVAAALAAAGRDPDGGEAGPTEGA